MLGAFEFGVVARPLASAAREANKHQEVLL
jgi:hypothetical protein